MTSSVSGNAGELFYSDVFAGRRVPEPLRRDPVLLGECLGGAMYIEDFRRILGKLDIRDHRTVSRRRLTLDDPAVAAQAGMIPFYSMTIRTFNVELEDLCENYGHVAWYLGSVPDCPHRFVLDDHHVFETGVPVPICGNTANMLGRSRFAGHFRIEGDFSTHYGPFDCAPLPAGAAPRENACC